MKDAGGNEMKLRHGLRSQGMTEKTVWVLGVLALVQFAALQMVVPAFAGDKEVAELSPEKTVESYLSAAQKGDFGAAYQYVSKGMAQDKGREAWAKEQQTIMQFSGVKILGFQVFPSKVEGEKAYVPNILDSQDNFITYLFMGKMPPPDEHIRLFQNFLKETMFGFIQGCGFYLDPCLR